MSAGPWDVLGIVLLHWLLSASAGTELREKVPRHAVGFAGCQKSQNGLGGMGP